MYDVSMLLCFPVLDVFIWLYMCRVKHANGFRKDLSSDEIITELKSELERCLTSNKMKRQQIAELQSDLNGYQSKTEELKKLLESAEKEAKECKVSIYCTNVILLHHVCLWMCVYVTLHCVHLSRQRWLSFHCTFFFCMLGQSKQL